MIILSQIYLMFKEKARAEFARKVLLENLKQNRKIFKKQLKKSDIQKTQFLWL